MVAHLKLFITTRLSRGSARAGHAGHCEGEECTIRLWVARNITHQHAQLRKALCSEGKKYTIRINKQGTGVGQDMRR